MLLLFFIVLFLIVLIYMFLSYKSEYWKRKGVPYRLPPKILFGNYAHYIFMRKNIGMMVDHICKQLPDAPYLGALYGTEPAVIVKDPELLKTVLTKDFYYFNSRELIDYIDKEIFLKNIFSEGGDYWKVIRQHLTPIFSSAKLKKMFYLIEKSNETFIKLLDQETSIQEEHEVRSLMARYTMDCVGSCVFGLETNVMGTNSDKNPFRIIADKIFDVSTERALKFMIRNFWPNIFFSLGFKFLPKQIETFFRELLYGVIKGRSENPPNRNDFIDLLLSLKANPVISGDSIKNMKTAEDKQRIDLTVDDDLLVAQCFIFFAAGFDTSSSTLSFTLYELAKDKEAQRRVHEEVDKYFNERSDKLDYDCTVSLPFLEACISETLRLYPVLGIINREVFEDYKLPDGVLLERTTRVQIPVYHLHMNPKYFPEPEVFRPERFMLEEKEKIVPYTYMPFGAGPRTCIGIRFAKMVMHSGMATFFKKYRVELAEGMPSTIDFEPKAQGFQSKTGIRLKIIPRDF